MARTRPRASRDLQRIVAAALDRPQCELRMSELKVISFNYYQTVDYLDASTIGQTAITATTPVPLPSRREVSLECYPEDTPALYELCTHAIVYVVLDQFRFPTASDPWGAKPEREESFWAKVTSLHVQAEVHVPPTMEVTLTEILDYGPA